MNALNDCEIALSDIEVHAPVISDHSVVSFKIAASNTVSDKKTITFRKLKNIDMNAMEHDIMACDFVKNPSDNLIGLANQYDEWLKSIFDKHAPEVTKQVVTRAADPWFTEDLKEMKTERRKAERRWRKSGLSIHLSLLKNNVEKF